MALTKISGDVIQTPLNVGVVTASRIDGDVNSTGVSTFSTLKVGSQVTVSGGIITATSFDGNVTGRINPSALNVTGVTTFAANVFHGDGDIAYFGDGNDLLIFHNSTDSIIRDDGTGDLFLQGGNKIRLTNPTGIETYAVFNQDGASELWYDNSKKFETTTSGVTVFGNITASSATITGNVSVAGTVTYDDVTNVDSLGVGTFRSGINVSSGGINIVGIATASGGFVGNLTGNLTGNVNATGVSTFNNVIVGGATTALLVSGNTRITGILTVGTSSLTFDGNSNTIAGLSTITGSSTFSKPSLAGISSTISDNAVDVFVYDTRKDSDGGAWRKRTQHTSWYNETLNTATRGSRRDFPAVAVAVAKTDTLTIYDGDDPDLPMWMVFEVNTDSLDLFINDSSSTLTSISALNGRIFAGSTRTGTTGNITGIDFIGDRGGMVYTSSSDIRTYNGGIGKRNDGLDNSAGTSNWFSSGPIVNRNVNDVAMTVLPNAPIDSATGLPVPTIAVATDGGFSVIKDDGTVINKVVSGTVTNKVDWYKNIYLLGTGPEYWALYKDLSAESGGYISDTADLYSAPNQSGWDKPQPSSLETRVAGANDLIVGAGSGGITLKQPPLSLSNGTTSLLCGITSTYNTGWMHGDIKGAFLSDTSTTSVTGTELLTNGGFTSNLSGWTDNSGSGSSIAWSSTGGGSIAFTGGAAYANATQAVTTVIGRTYTIVATEWLAGGGGATSIYIGAGNTPPSGGTDNFYASASSVSQTLPVICTFTATATTTYISIGSGWNGVIIGGMSLRVGEDNRSVNVRKGLQVFGTITKTAVATGADLVAYGGWSGSNYLYQPYNSAFNFGTGDFCIMCWVKESNFASNQFNTIIDIAQTGSNTGRIELIYAYSNLRITLETTATTSSLSSPTNTWLHVAAVRTGGTINLYENGVLTTTGASTNNFNNTSVNTYIGINYAGGNAGTGKQISLLRISSSAPSPDQIKKIYNDEKMLFQDNSKATLYGTSSAVTALAYDDSTRLLYAGTSSGRSDFQGLERINNTTTAVTTAISASNGLVAEQ